MKYEDHKCERILLICCLNAEDGQSIVETAEVAMRLARSVNQERSARGLLWIELFCILFFSWCVSLNNLKWLILTVIFLSRQIQDVNNLR